MRNHLSRRAFLGSLAVSGVMVPAVTANEHRPLLKMQDQDEADLHLDPSLVYRFVRIAHLNLDRTKSMLQEEPRLLRATWEWGPGDFEMAIDGAAHSGSRDIIQFLVSQGAPYSVFSAATLGDLKTVEAAVEQFPRIALALGPHEIPLIEHALAGGEPAAEVVKFLRKQGAEPREAPKDLPTEQEYRDVLIGTYHLAAQGRELDFRIYAEGKNLFIDAGPLGIKRLQFQGQDIFQLKGTPAQLTFEIVDGRAVAVVLREGAPIGRAERIDE